MPVYLKSFVYMFIVLQHGQLFNFYCMEFLAEVILRVEETSNLLLPFSGRIYER